MNHYLKKGVKFECQGSSNCCVSRNSYGYVYLSKFDLKRLLKFFKLESDIFIKKFCSKKNGYLHLKEKDKTGNCIFLNDKKCTIYVSRPEQCRTWPFWPENMNSKTWKNDIVNFCPGIGKGKFFSYDRIKKILNNDRLNDKKIIKIK